MRIHICKSIRRLAAIAAAFFIVHSQTDQIQIPQPKFQRLNAIKYCQNILISHSAKEAGCQEGVHWMLGGRLGATPISLSTL